MSNQTVISPQKYLLAVDGSDNSLAVINYISNLPLPKDSIICVVAVLDTPHTLRRQLLLAALEQASKILNEQKLNVELGLLHGHPASSIIDFANDYKPDLIALGAKGLRATMGILLGGVVQQVAEHAHWPVLIIRHTNQPPYHYLVAVDGSEQSRYAITYLSRFPYDKKATWHLVHVVPPMPAYEPGNIPKSLYIGTDIFQAPTMDISINSDEWVKKYEAKGNEILNQSIHSLAQSEIHPVSTMLHGDAATEILNYSKNNMIDIIFVGSRGLSEVSGWLMGSVSRKLVHYASCSVLVVK